MTFIDALKEMSDGKICIRWTSPTWGILYRLNSGSLEFSVNAITPKNEYPAVQWTKAHISPKSYLEDTWGVDSRPYFDKQKTTMALYLNDISGIGQYFREPPISQSWIKTDKTIEVNILETE